MCMALPIYVHRPRSSRVDVFHSVDGESTDIGRNQKFQLLQFISTAARIHFRYPLETGRENGS